MCGEIDQLHRRVTRCGICLWPLHVGEKWRTEWLTVQSSTSPSRCEWRLDTLSVQCFRGTFPFSFLSLRQIPDCCLLMMAARVWQDQLRKIKVTLNAVISPGKLFQFFLYLKDLGYRWVQKFAPPLYLEGKISFKKRTYFYNLTFKWQL